MQTFNTLHAVAVPLDRANVDTDQILPARFLKKPRSAGYGGFLFHDERRRSLDFPLDQPVFRGAAILVADRNFGCGSSREGAVYGLLDGGIRCVIAPSFGDIFAQNCTMNGLLMVSLTEAQIEELLASPEIVGAKPIRIDLEAQRIMCGDASYAFDIDPLRKTKLLNGWDDIDITLTHAADIARFVAADARERPWALPHRPQGAA